MTLQTGSTAGTSFALCWPEPRAVACAHRLRLLPTWYVGMKIITPALQTEAKCSEHSGHAVS